MIIKLIVVASAVGFVAYKLDASLIALWSWIMAAVLIWGKSKTSGRAEYGHAHGNSAQDVAEHEGAHIAASKKHGYGYSSARIWDGGGVVRLRKVEKLTPTQYMTIMKAGRARAGGRVSCRGDMDNVKAEKTRMRRSGVSARDIAEADRQSDRLARRVAGANSVDGYAKKLLRGGRA